MESIKNLGLKKPIQVSIRGSDEGDEPGYDLVCGQGRMEAFQALGHKEIPAIVVEVCREDRLLRSLAENIARRPQSKLALMNEIDRLNTQGDTNAEIARKLDVPPATVAGLLALKNAGEERILAAAVTGRIPVGVAMDIAKADTVELQREFLRAYESKQLNKGSIRVVKRLMDKRRYLGKRIDPLTHGPKTKTNAENLVSVYKRESQRQLAIVKKARLCEAKLVFITQAINDLLTDEHFVALLQAEYLDNLPKCLADKVTFVQQEAA